LNEKVEKMKGKTVEIVLFILILVMLCSYYIIRDITLDDQAFLILLKERKTRMKKMP